MIEIVRVELNDSYAEIATLQGFILLNTHVGRRSIGSQELSTNWTPVIVWSVISQCQVGYLYV